MSTTTIKDVAKYLNVSVSTISRVMNGRGRVSSETRKRVLDAVKKMNYVPNNSAVSIITKQTKVIVALVPDLYTPFFLNVVQGIEEVAKSKGYFTMVFSTEGSHEEERDFVNGSMGRFADGIIAIPSTPDLSVFSNVDKPIVFVDRFNDDYSFDCVVIDDFHGAYIATEHLIKMGHKKIAIIAGQRGLNIGKGRLWGFEQAMRDNRIDPADDYIRLNSWSEEAGYNETLKLIGMPSPPTAIFAANENICRGVIKAVSDADMLFARDISLVGFDDNELARFNKPKVTVINRPTNEMGVVGASMLFEKMENSKGPSLSKKITLPIELVVRESVKNLA